MSAQGLRYLAVLSIEQLQVMQDWGCAEMVVECQATDTTGCCQKLTLRPCSRFYVFGMYC